MEVNKMENLNKIVTQIPDPDWKIICGEGDIVSNFAKRLKLNSTQLRKFFDEVKQIEIEVKEKGWENVEGKLYLLIPSIKYAKARKLCSREFVYFIENSIKKINETENEEEKIKRFKNFVKIFEAIIAYHKYYEKKGD
ncbi:type III-A CRISPR-associated protein Csm2 [Thermococci archaeon]|nr:MAG: type III-A CRISPR-associated protein Csm2 [Thermococci archaeon]